MKSLVMETGTVNVPGCDLFKIQDCFPIVWKPRDQWLTDDPDCSHNQELHGVSGKNFGEFHYRTNGTFHSQFRRGNGKIEENILPAILHINELTQEALLEEIATTLGERAETKMGQIVGLVCKQPNGEPGVLDTEGENIFFVRSSPEAQLYPGELTTVRIFWDSSRWDSRWRFDEFIIRNVHPVRLGTRVFSA